MFYINYSFLSQFNFSISSWIVCIAMMGISFDKCFFEINRIFDIPNNFVE